MKQFAIDFLSGHNCALVCYGTHKSGKSYTMFGRLENKNAFFHLGIMPRMMTYIINKLEYHDIDHEHSLDWNCIISFAEIYQVLYI